MQMFWNRGTPELIHGAYYWLRARTISELGNDYGNYLGIYIGQYVEGYRLDNGEEVFLKWFEVCGDESHWDILDFDVLEIIDYKGK